MANQAVNVEEGLEKIDESVGRLIGILRKLRVGEEPKNFSKTDFFDVYNVCYKLCVDSGSQSSQAIQKTLYEKHSETFQEYLTNEVVPSLAGLKDEEFLRTISKRWEEHKLMNRWLFLFFRYLDKYYVKHTSVPELLDSGTQKFKEIVYALYKDSFVKFVLDLVDKEREGDIIDASLLHSCIEIFVSLSGSVATKDSADRKTYKYVPTIIDVYTNDFEKSFLQRSKKYFEAKSKLWVAQLPAGEFLKVCDEQITKESDRCEKFFQPASKDVWMQANPGASVETDFKENEIGTLYRLLKLLRETILQENETEVLNKPESGLRVMLSAMKRDQMRLLYNLYKEVDKGLVPIAAIIKIFVEEEGRKIEGTTKKADEIVKLVENYIALHDRFEDLVVQEFANNGQVSRAMKEAFELFLNQEREDKITFAELLATFIDFMLKSTKVDEETREASVTKGVKLFLYLQEKDRFAEIYRGQLSKRLLSTSNADFDLEKRMIAKIKAQTGAGFTSKMEGMVRDLMTGKDLQKDFQAYCKEKGLAQTQFSQQGMVSVDGMDFTADLLTIAWWPNNVEMELNYPPQMQKCLNMYENFFKAKNDAKKRITWVHSLGNVVMKARIGKKNLELTLTTLQAACLMLFNKDEPIHFQDVMKDLNVDINVCKKVLHSFLRMGILNKQGSDNAKKIDGDADEFFVNDALEVKRTKFKVPLASLEESHSTKKVADERNETIDASIVRTMKTRKTLGHNALVTEVLGQLHFFRPEAKNVKLRIESLIEREYLERDDNDPQLYHYVA